MVHLHKPTYHINDSGPVGPSGSENPTRSGQTDPVFRLQHLPASPELDEPVEDEEDEEAEEQHVAQQFGLTASGQLLHSADGGAEQTPGRVKVRVLVTAEGGPVSACSPNHSVHSRNKHYH